MKSKTVAAGKDERGNEVARNKQAETNPAEAPSIEEIQQRAYEIHLEGGRVHGRDQDDWFQAERELVEKP